MLSITSVKELSGVLHATAMFIGTVGMIVTVFTGRVDKDV